MKWFYLAIGGILAGAAAVVHTVVPVPGLEQVLQLGAASLLGAGGAVHVHATTPTDTKQ